MIFQGSSSAVFKSTKALYRSDSYDPRMMSYVVEELIGDNNDNTNNNNNNNNNNKYTLTNNNNTANGSSTILGSKRHSDSDTVQASSADNKGKTTGGSIDKGKTTGGSIEGVDVYSRLVRSLTLTLTLCEYVNMLY